MKKMIGLVALCVASGRIMVSPICVASPTTVFVDSTAFIPFIKDSITPVKLLSAIYKSSFLNNLSNRPRKFQADLTVGMDDPAATGKILSYYGMLYPLIV